MLRQPHPMRLLSKTMKKVAHTLYLLGRTVYRAGLGRNGGTGPLMLVRPTFLPGSGYYWRAGRDFGSVTRGSVYSVGVLLRM